MRNGNNKFFKLIKNKVTWIVIIAVIATLITIPNIRTKADIVKTEVKILEVEPGDKFQLNSGSYEGYKVTVSHIDMPTFVSMVDEISGKYDIVCIGNKIDGLGGTDKNKQWGDKNTFAYREYIKENDSINHFGYMYLTDSYDAKTVRALWYGSGGCVPKDNGIWANVNDYASYNITIPKDGKDEKINFLRAKYNLDTNNDGEKETYQFVMDEYYSGNDITNRRAEQVINFIESNQLVYLDTKAISIEGTKLKNNFNKYITENRSNVKCTEGFSIYDIISNYKSLKNISPIVEVTENPTPYDGTKNTSTTDEQKTNMNTIEGDRNLKIGFKVTGDSSKKYKAKLYIDDDNDGQFIDSEEKCEAVSLIDVNSIDGNGINYISYNVPKFFGGYVSWKLVVFEAKDGEGNKEFIDDSNRIKTYVTGNCAYKAESSKDVEINVLQLLPDESKVKVTLNMLTNGKFKEKIAEVKEKLGINITVTTKKMSDFTSEVDSKIKTKENPNGLTASKYADSLIKNYDMIIIGFGDNATQAEDDAFSTASVEVLKEWNNKKMALMFTHDTISLNVLDEVSFYDVDNHKYWPYKSPANDYLGGTAASKNLTQGFKNLVGQSVYEDPFDSSTWGDEDYLTVGNGLKNIESSLNSLIGKDDNGLAALGPTAFANVKLYEKTKVEKVIGVNEAQITSYPYNLNNKLNRDYRDYTEEEVKDKQVNSSGMDIAMTHTQWYQLNLEKDDLVPWINLYGTPMNMGDARNAYYTYNIGNITYSGSGHSDVTGDDELELFINTIIKAMAGANIKPEISNHYYDTEEEIKEGTTVSTDLGKPYDFKVRLYDADSNENDDIRYIVTFGSETLKDETVKYTIQRYNNNGMYVDCSIPEDKLASYMGQTIPITTKAIDKYGAESDVKTFYIKVEIKDIELYHGVNREEVNNPSFVIKNSPLNNNNYSDSLSSSWDNISGKLILDTIERDYQSIIPFAACARLYDCNSRLKLKLDDKFKEAYVGDNALAPTAYCINHLGELSRIGELTYDSENKYYYIDLDGSIIKSHGGYFTDGTCLVVIRYYAKAYEHDTSSSGRTVYTNKISVSIGEEDIAEKPASIYVKYSEPSGMLY